MDVRLTPLSPIPIVMIRHRGPYEELSSEFDRLWEWVTANGVPAARTIGIYWDNPDYVSARQLRSAACVEVPVTYQLMDRGGLPLELSQIVGGTYATTRFVGPYEELAPVWSRLTQQIEGGMGRRISSDPAFEIYVNDPSDTPPDRLITDLYMPVL